VETSPAPPADAAASAPAPVAASSAAPFAAACLAIAIFSGMDALMKLLSIQLGAYNAMAWRTVVGLGLTAAIFLARRQPWPARPVLKLHLFRGLAAASSILLFFWGLVHVPMAQGIALSFIAPLIALALAALFLKEQVTRKAWTASLIAFAGVLVILLGQPAIATGPEALWGSLAILLAALFYAINLVVARAQSLVAGPLEVALFFNIVAALLYSTAAPWLLTVPPMEALPLIVAAAITSVISIMLLAWAYARAEAQVLLPVEYTAFIWAVLLGWLVFGEAVTLATLAGAAMIVAGCIWAARQSGRTASTDPEISA
jgi:S-adenosylmethionine uptake transporter